MMNYNARREALNKKDWRIDNNSYIVCMCGEIIKWAPLTCDDWRLHIKCVGRDNLVRFDGTRWDNLERFDFIEKLTQWQATF